MPKTGALPCKGLYSNAGNRCDPTENGLPLKIMPLMSGVHSGTLSHGMDLINAHTGASERLGQLYTINGHDRDPVDV